MGATSYIVAAERIDWLREQIDKLNRRAARLGVPPVSLAVSEPRTLTQEAIDAMGNANLYRYAGRVYHEVSSSTEAVRLAGWTLIAVVQHEGDAGNILRIVPGSTDEDLPERFRAGGAECDHCRTARRRRDTYIVRHEDGRWAQVGSSCLSDFLNNSVAGFLAAAGFALDVEALFGDCDPDGFLGFSAEPRAWAIETFLRVTWRVIRSFGWVSRREASDGTATATADRVMAFLTSPVPNARTL